MKLSPRASSSDLDEARAIARRLSATGVRPAPAAPAPAETRYVAFGGDASGTLRREVPPARPEAPPRPEPEPLAPTVAESRATEPATSSDPDAAPALTIGGQDGDEEMSFDSAPEPRETLPPPEEPQQEAGPDPSAEEPFDLPPPAEASPFGEESPLDLPATEEAASAPPEAEDPLAGLTGEDEPGAAPPPATWDDVLDGALRVSGAQAALLLDARGSLAAARGDWPAGRLDALAPRLNPAIEKANPAPGEPLSVRLGAQVLTAWRSERNGQWLTIGFLGDAAVPNDRVPDVEAELLRGPA